ncbi:MAG: aldo/keto reductase [Gammaproteobacteria bacterium]
MKYRPLGDSGISASVIGLGTWALGGWMWGGTDEAEAIRTIQSSLDVGVSLIDTAPSYGLGLAEELIGKAISGRRQQAIVATKCGLVWHAQKGQFFFEEHGRRVYRFLGRASIRHEIEQSLRRLGTDYVDLYQTHWSDRSTPIEETMAALLELKGEGKIRAIGSSNTSPADLNGSRRIGAVDAVQQKYSMLDREADSDLLPYARTNHMAFLAYSPLGCGLLAGKMPAERRFPAGDHRRNDSRFLAESRAHINQMLEKLEPLAKSLQASLSQLVLAWTLSVPGVTHALVGSRNVEQARINAGAADFEVPADMMARVRVLIQAPPLAGSGGVRG